MNRSKKLPPRNYPRALRVNSLLQEILAEELERLSDHDERLEMCTITGVACDPDLRHAVVFLSSLVDSTSEALLEHRHDLQSAVATQAHMRRVPALKFVVDPAIIAGGRVEEALRRASETGSVESDE